MALIQTQLFSKKLSKAPSLLKIPYPLSLKFNFNLRAEKPRRITKHYKKNRLSRS